MEPMDGVRKRTNVAGETAVHRMPKYSIATRSLYQLRLLPQRKPRAALPRVAVLVLHTGFFPHHLYNCIRYISPWVHQARHDF